MTKSGTTAIQAFLAANDRQLRSQRLLYARTGRASQKAGDHSAIFKALAFEQGKQPAIGRSRHTADDYVAQLRAEIAESNPRCTILSSEAIYTNADSTYLQAIRHILGFAELRVLLVLRQQQDWVQSSYAQRVTGPERTRDTPHMHLARAEARGLLDYDARVKLFQDSFGAGRVHVFWYEEIKRDIVAPVADLAAIEIRPEFVRVPRENMRMTWFSIRALRAMNHVAGHHPKVRRSTRQAIQVLDRSIRALGLADFSDRAFAPYSPAELELMRRSFEERNQRLAERLASAKDKPPVGLRQPSAAE